MPNLVVYVPTKLWNRIEALGLTDPKIEARKVARGALESWLSEAGGSVRARTPDREADAKSGDTPVSESQPKPRKRMYACSHFVPPSKVCEVCDR